MAVVFCPSWASANGSVSSSIDSQEREAKKRYAQSQKTFRIIVISIELVISMALCRRYCLLCKTS
jgi:hypothetical protein